MDRLESDLEGRAEVVRLNVQDPVGRMFTERLNFRFTPTFILLDGEGNEVWRALGSLDRDEVLRQVAALE